MKPVSRPCAKPGCRAWARKDGPFCSSHSPRPRPAVAQADHATNQRLLLEFFKGIFTKEEYDAVDHLVTARGQPMDVEMAIIRVLLRRVMKRIGTGDPVKALPLVRQAVDAMCRTLRTQRVLSGQAGDTFSETLATLLEQWGELSAPVDPAEAGGSGDNGGRP